MSDIFSIDPATGKQSERVAAETTADEVDRLALGATRAARQPWPRIDRARMLRGLAEQLRDRRDEIVPLAMRETALPKQRIEGELTRTAYQADFFADLVEEGSFLEATVDHAGETPMGPGPDLRRMLVPLGPVAVFGASNFPLAFSVPGGDTVSALAAGCPVLVKAHDSHAALSMLTFGILKTAAESSGAPEGTVSIVFGIAAGARLVANQHIRAVGFTGSLSGGQALLRIIEARQEPIPFFGEMSSLNPVVITGGAAREKGEALGEALVASATGSAGQFCTKPGLVLVPRGPHGDTVVAGASAAISEQTAWTLLSTGIAQSYRRAVSQRADPVAQGTPGDGPADVASALYEYDAEDLTTDLMQEVFGPTTLLVRYDETEFESLLDRLPASLTATVWRAESGQDDVEEIDSVLRQRAGRVVYNGWPTGVIVGHAQNHGGPWPSTNTTHTSVGATAVRRFLRPVAWQDAPEDVLPPELRDNDPGIPRRVDGQLILPSRT